MSPDLVLIKKAPSRDESTNIPHSQMRSPSVDLWGPLCIPENLGGWDWIFCSQESATVPLLGLSPLIMFCVHGWRTIFIQVFLWAIPPSCCRDFWPLHLSAFIYPLFLYLPGFSWFWETGVSLGAAFFPAFSKESLSLALLPTAAAFITHL